ncbi:hypothetical protein QYF36_013140 [Acer negundo]|nr:hypothetical protein QYF36_013140 [Acer negundo]
MGGVSVDWKIRQHGEQEESRRLKEKVGYMASRGGPIINSEGKGMGASNDCSSMLIHSSNNISEHSLDFIAALGQEKGNLNAPSKELENNLLGSSPLLNQEQGSKVGVVIEFKNVGVEYGDRKKGDETHVVCGMEQEASEVVTESEVATLVTEEVNDEISAGQSLPARRTQ